MASSPLPSQKQMTGMLGHPVVENPIDLMFDAVYAHYGLPWQFWKCDVAAQDLPAAIAGTRALGFRGYGITVPYKIAAIPHLDAVDEDVRVIGAANYVTVECAPPKPNGHSTASRTVIPLQAEHLGAKRRVCLRTRPSAARSRPPSTRRTAREGSSSPARDRRNRRWTASRSWACSTG